MVLSADKRGPAGGGKRWAEVAVVLRRKDEKRGKNIRKRRERDEDDEKREKRSRLACSRF